MEFTDNNNPFVLNSDYLVEEITMQEFLNAIRSLGEHQAPSEHLHLIQQVESYGY